ncbi:MAG: glycogen debranching N-terminal domain-containing protein [Acidobacteriaceae bacterium]
MNEDRPLLIQLDPRGQHFHISQGRTVLITSLEGAIQVQALEGLWVLETRLLSSYAWEVYGKAPTLSVLSATRQNRSLGYYVFAPRECRRRKVPGCDPAQNSVELKIDREVGEGLIEKVTAVNHTLLETNFVLSLRVGADFVAPAEATGKRKQRGVITKAWHAERDRCSLEFNYKASHHFSHQGDSGRAEFNRGIRLEVTNDQQPPRFSGVRLRFQITLKPREEWHATLAWTALVSERELPPPNDEREQKRAAFLSNCASYEAPADRSIAPVVLRTIRQAADDLAALRLYDLDSKDALGERWVPAGGIPMYVGLFARDVLFSSCQAATASTDMLRGSLAELAKHLGTRTDNWRDEQPGRIIHEIHSHPLAELNYTPHGRYFGGVTGSIFYGFAVADLWRWTGNKEIVAPFIEPALRALAWADQHSRDKSGFYKYQTRSEQGEKNQGWKDSDDAIVYPDGSQVSDSLGTCEMQGCVYATKRSLSHLLWAMGDKQRSRGLANEAEELKQRFNEMFWMPEAGFMAMGIDSNDRPIRSIASGPGHCLRYGIIDDRYREAVARRLMAGDLFSGWGVRTLSSEHPSYNPFSYHCGSVWPVENGELVMALARCGLWEEAQRLARGIFDAAALFRYCRLPEVFSGHPRDDAHPFPALYPRTNSPQAWSASAPFLIMEALLGIQAYAPLQLLLIDPHLPDWLPKITLHNLQVGQARISIQFSRKASGKTDFKILDTHGDLRVLRHADPWSLIEQPGKELHAALAELKKTA